MADHDATLRNGTLGDLAGRHLLACHYRTLTARVEGVSPQSGHALMSTQTTSLGAVVRSCVAARMRVLCGGPDAPVEWSPGYAGPPAVHRVSLYM